MISDGKLYDVNSFLMEHYNKYPSDGLLIEHKFHKHLLDQIRGKSFLNRGSVMVSTGLMDDKVFNSVTMNLLQ